MVTERVVEQYRKYTLISAHFRGDFLGRVLKGDEKIHEIKGASIHSVLMDLRSIVDAKFKAATGPEAREPEIQEYIAAFRRMLGTLSDGHCAMLKAHYHAPNRLITATQLAAAAHYRNYGAANLQYGLVGRALYEELPMPLPSRPDGSLIYTYALATAGERSGPEDQWLWQLKDQVAVAMVMLGLHN